MAEKLKKSAFETKLPQIKRGLADVNDRKERAREHNASAAARTKDICDSNGVNKWAFTATSQLLKKEPTEQIDRAVTFFALALETGALDQIDLFDDRLAFIREKLEAKLSEAPVAAPGAGMVAALAAVN